ncbi:RNA polymerase sigma factor [Sediminibacterium roseum]|uniref:RNA polymerase sigma factor n=1 Tax=Sediminibacterium roseum TaxID=1978412 RepID=A0ABW9ZSN5_9BACT|nr:RNA polymerase sigma factor [Sediminibacterium roseum]
MELDTTITIHEELIERCKRGDSSGYTGLYNLHAKEVYNTIFRLVQHTAEAEDILQDSFLAAYQAIDGFQNTGGFRAWIKRIAINKSINWIRRNKMKIVEMDTGNMKIEDEEAIDERAFTFKMEEVQKAIAALPEPYRTIFQLYAIENIPQVEIAQMLGIANNTVRIQYHRAKLKILRTLKEGGIS